MSNQSVALMSIYELGLSPRVENALVRCGLKTVSDLILLQEKAGFSSIRTIGEKSAQEITRALETITNNPNLFLKYLPLESDVGLRLQSSLIIHGYPDFKDEDSRTSPFLSRKSDSQSINLLNISPRVSHVLKRSGIFFIEDLMECPWEKIRSIRGIGEIAIENLKEETMSYKQRYSNRKSDDELFGDDLRKIGGLSKQEIEGKIQNILSVFGIDHEVIDWSWEYFLRSTMSWKKTQEIANKISAENLCPLLSLPEDSLLGHETIRFLIELGCPLDQIPSGRIALNKGQQIKLIGFGIRSFFDLVTISKQYLEQYFDLSEILISNIDYYASWLTTKVDWQSEIDSSSLSPVIARALKEASFDNIIEMALQGINSSRNRAILLRRYESSETGKNTLGELGKEYNVTRERIRQIITQSQIQINRTINNNNLLVYLLNFTISIVEEKKIVSLEYLSSEIGEALEIDEEELSKILLLLLGVTRSALFLSSKRLVISNKDIKNKYTSISSELARILRQKKIPTKQNDLLKEFRNISSYGSIDDYEIIIKSILTFDETFELVDDEYWGLSSWDKKYLDDLVMVMRIHKEPLHFTDLAALVNERINIQKKISANTVHGALSRNISIFVRTGPGTFALKELFPDLKEQPTKYLDLIKRVLVEAQKPVSIDHIFSEVDRIRAANKNSIIMYLSMHDDFIDYGNNKFGLAEWKSNTNQSRSQLSPDIPNEIIESMRRKAMLAFEKKKKGN